MPPEAARKGSSATSWVTPLPRGYRVAETLRFHGRDAERIAEAVDGTTIRKGVVWGGSIAAVEIALTDCGARCRFLLDQPARRAADSPECLVARLLGLGLDVSAFEAAVAGHPLLGPLIQRQTGLHIPMAATPYEALSWAITGQQISLRAALALRRRLIVLAARRHSSGLWASPDAADVVAIGEQRLREAGYSAAKAGTLIDVSRLVVDGDLPLDAWLAAGTDPLLIREGLLGVRGIGPWTANYTLLRGFGWGDGSLHGDVAVRNALSTLIGGPGRLSMEQAEQWLAPFAPWRSLVAAHLWAALAALRPGPVAGEARESPAD